MCKVYSADQIIGSILCVDNTKEIKLNSLYVLEKKVRISYPNVIFLMREDDVLDALDSYPDVFSFDGNSIVLSKKEHSFERVKSYFSSLVDPEVLQLVCKTV